MQHASNPQQKNEVVQVDLTIGQCRLLQSLIDAEIYEAEAQTSRFTEDALKAVYDVFHSKTKPTTAEAHADVEKWVQNLEARRFAHG